MADAPSETTAQALRKPERNPDGTLKKGFSGNPGGNKALPSLYTDLTPVGLAVQAALATGVVVEELIPEGLSEEQRASALVAIQGAAMAGALDPDLRGKHADIMISRRHGKPKESLEIDSTTRTIREVVLRVVPAPSEKPVIAVKPQAKALK